MFFKVKKFKPSDLLDITLANDAELVKKMFPETNDMLKWGQLLVSTAATDRNCKLVAYTAFVGNKPILAGGIQELVEGQVGEAWLVVGEGFQKHAKSCIKAVKEQLERMDFLRIQAFCDEGFVQAERLLQTLGFEYEATIEAIGPNGGNRHLYKMIRR